jgi:hypothetical protein
MTGDWTVKPSDKTASLPSGFKVPRKASELDPQSKIVSLPPGAKIYTVPSIEFAAPPSNWKSAQKKLRKAPVSDWQIIAPGMAWAVGPPLVLLGLGARSCGRLRDFDAHACPDLKKT